MLRASIIILSILHLGVCFGQQLSHPESVAYDSASATWFVSNPGNGTLVKIDSKGDTSTIAVGLSIPLGLVFFEESIWIADSACLRNYTSEGVLIKRIDVPHARQLNGIIVSPEGHLIVSDRRGDAVLKVNPNTGGIDTLLYGSIHIPNGLAIFRDTILLIVNSTEDASMFLVNMKTGTIIKSIPANRSFLDGVTRFVDDYFIVSSWGTGWKDPALLLFDLHAFHPPTIIENRPDAPADIHYFSAAGKLAIPAYYSNRLEFILFEDLFRMCFLQKH